MQSSTLDLPTAEAGTINTKLSCAELIQATRELLRYLEEFPEQTEFSPEEIADWYIDVVLPLELAPLEDQLYDLCEKYYPSVTTKVAEYLL